MTEGKIAVIGGSIAGCAAALAVHRAGAEEITVFERTTGGLEDRGVGIGIHGELSLQLEAAGYVDPEMPYLQLAERKWITWDGESYGGQLVGTQPFDFRAYDWGSVWQGLRDRIPGSVRYRTGCRVTSVVDTADEVVVTLSDGTEDRFDRVFGADGYRSVVRAVMFPDLRPQYAGYLLWRGTVPAADLPERKGLWESHEAVGVVFADGHLMMYLIPGRFGEPVLNWAVYAAPPAEQALELDDPTSLPPGSVGAELLDYLRVLAEKLPLYWREVLRVMPREKIFAQPIYDMYVPSCVNGRLALVGDAAAVARPHTGGGAVKALQDAATLQSVLSREMTWPDALHAYDRQRAPVNRSLVELGRALGSATVLEPPNWREMVPERFTEWWGTVTAKGTLGGVKLSN
jgi:2-polyprenyl-6-methoxyphenol hydroxylase-like FAD-dependent oxidoreductase